MHVLVIKCNFNNYRYDLFSATHVHINLEHPIYVYYYHNGVVVVENSVRKIYCVVQEDKSMDINIYNMHKYVQNV